MERKDRPPWEHPRTNCGSSHCSLVANCTWSNFLHQAPPLHLGQLPACSQGTPGFQNRPRGKRHQDGAHWMVG